MALGQMAGNENQNPLARFKWQNRFLLVFAPSAGYAPGLAQIKELQPATAGFVERDLLLIRVYGNKVAGPTNKDLLAADLRQAFGIAPGAFTIILIGKDGGEKYRNTQVTKSATIFRIIDAMPMRQQEMQQK